jgi:hypothetical protein
MASALEISSEIQEMTERNVLALYFAKFSRIVYYADHAIIQMSKKMA